MNSKSLLIPIAAFALSATSVSAYNTDVLQNAGLTAKQIDAFQTARDLQNEGNKNKARTVLQNAGIGIETIESVRQAAYAYKNAMRLAITSAVEQNDFVAFKTAVKDSPLSDIITTQPAFESFAEAYKLRSSENNDSDWNVLAELKLQASNPIASSLNTIS